MPDPETTDAYRARVRVSVGDRYSAPLHFALTNALGWGALLLALSQVHGPSLAEWLTVPLTLVYANLVEYVAHRGPMHHALGPFGFVYRRHGIDHHRFFTRERMPIEQLRDIKLVLFPPGLVAFFFLTFALPAFLILARLTTPNIAGLFVATSLGYFLAYEWLHLAYHLPDRALGSLHLVRRLRKLHQDHHHPANMLRGNFNITVPLGDWLFRTRLRPDAEEARP